MTYKELTKLAANVEDKASISQINGLLTEMKPAIENLEKKIALAKEQEKEAAEKAEALKV